MLIPLQAAFSNAPAGEGEGIGFSTSDGGDVGVVCSAIDDDSTGVGKESGATSWSIFGASSSALANLRVAVVLVLVLVLMTMWVILQAVLLSMTVFRAALMPVLGG